MKTKCPRLIGVGLGHFVLINSVNEVKHKIFATLVHFLPQLLG